MQEEYCTLDTISRKLTLTEPQRIAGVESDEYAKGLKFKFPKIVDNIDLTQMQLRINFMNSRGEKDQYIVTDMKPLEGEENYIIFTWPFSRLVTHYRGYTKLVVCAVKTDENGTITAEWNTALAQMRVLEGLEVDKPDVTPEEKDVISQLISICQNSADEAAQSAQQAQEEAEKVLTYGPKIGANGNWIVGGEDTGQPSQGFSPTVQTKPIGNGTKVTITDKNGEKSFEVKDGKDGDPGAPGKNGTTPNIQIGTVETLPPGSQATVTNTGTTETPVFNFGIPQGKDSDGSIGEWKLLRTIIQPSDISTDTSDITWHTRENGEVYGFSFITDDLGEKYNAKEIMIAGVGNFTAALNNYVDIFNGEKLIYHMYAASKAFSDNKNRFTFLENLLGNVSVPLIYTQKQYASDVTVTGAFGNITPPYKRDLEYWNEIAFYLGQINNTGTYFNNLQVTVYGRV